MKVDFNACKKIWWMTANTDYWDLSSLKIGSEHQYTRYNDNGRLRRIPSAFLKIKKGDLIVGYATGNGSKSAVCALLQCSHALTKKKFKGEDVGEHIRFVKIKDINPGIPREIFKKHPVLKNASMVRSRFQGSLFEFNDSEGNAMIELLQEASKRRYWIYTPGRNIRESWDFEADIRDGVMGLGQDRLGDLSQYGSNIAKIAAKMRKYYSVTSGVGNAQYLLKFRDEMSPGDVVFVRRGLFTLAGAGVVTGDYRFDEKRKESKQVRSVNWLWKGEVKTSIRFSITTLANISDEDKIKELCSLSGLTEMDLNHYESSKFISSEETMIHDKSGYKSDKPRNSLLSPEEAEERLRTIKRTVKAREVLQREGQRELRNLVVSKSGCCCVTGLKIDSMLIVSHIKDWKYSTNEERLDPENVLLLAKNYDAAFDRKLISFDSSGRLLKSNSISWKELALLGIKKSARLIQLSEKREKYLAWHRDRLLE